VAASATTDVSRQTLAELGDDEDKVLAEAPLLASGGTIGVLASGGLVLRDGAWAEKRDGQREIAAAADVRFADFDGDGLTDVITTSDGEVKGFAFYAGGRHDPGAELASVGAKNIDDAVARAVAIAPSTVTGDEACALLGKIKSAKSLREVATADLLVAAYEEPGEPGDSSKVVTKDVWKELQDQPEGGSCKAAMSCDSVRSVCTLMWAPPGVDYFLFVREAGKLKLKRAAVYRGT
jgi:hypothetical protein